MEEGITFTDMKELKVGKYIIVDDIACRVVDIETSKPGKHGAAKMRITAMGIFDGQKKTLLKPSDATVEAPVITKKKGQVVSIEGSNVQIMDLETYDVYTLPIPEDMTGKLAAGNEIEVLEALGRRALSRIVN